MTDPRVIDDINRKLDVLIRLTAYQLVAGKTLTNGAPILRRLGLTPTEIAAIFGSTPGAVGVRLAESRRPKSKKPNPENA